MCADGCHQNTISKVDSAYLKKTKNGQVGTARKAHNTRGVAFGVIQSFASEIVIPPMK